jgi:hypothetical protein
VQVRDWYVDSFKELRQFPEVRDSDTELKFTSLLKVRQQSLCTGHACAMLYRTGWHVRCTSLAIHGLSGDNRYLVAHHSPSTTDTEMWCQSWPWVWRSSSRSYRTMWALVIYLRSIR